MTASYDNLQQIAATFGFQQRVKFAVLTQAFAIYSEAISVTGSISGTNQITGLSGTAGITPGMLVIGPGLPGNTMVLSVGTGATVTLSGSATASLSGAAYIFQLPNHAARAAFANKVCLNTGYDLSTLAMFVCVSSGTISNEANVNSPPDFTIADIDILNAMGAIWNTLAGA